jgi:hypothetical protein
LAVAHGGQLATFDGGGSAVILPAARPCVGLPGTRPQFPAARTSARKP